MKIDPYLYKCFIICLYLIRGPINLIKANISNSEKGDVVGMWQSVIEDKGSELIIIFDIKITETDSLVCTIHWPEMGMSNIPYGTFLLQQDSILLPGLKARKHEGIITGVLSAMGPVMDIELERITQKPKFTVYCPEKNPDWAFDTKASIWSPPAIYEDHLLFGNDEGSFYSISLKNMEEAWLFTCDGAIKSKADAVNNRVLFASDDGFLYKLDSRSGNLLWKTDIGNAISPRITPAKDVYTYDYLCSSPIQDKDVIYVGSKDSCVYAINAKDGFINWKFKTGDIVRSTPAVDGDLVYVGSWDHFMYALNTNDGKLIWKFDAGGSIQSSPLIVDDKVIFGSRSGSVFALNKNAGKELWKTGYWGSWVESSPVYYDYRVYVGSSDFRKVFALEPATGQVFLNTHMEGWAWATPAIAQDYIFTSTVGSLYYTETMHGRFYALDRTSGEPVWRMHVEDDPDVFAYGFASSPVLWNDWVFVGGLDGKMYGIKIK